MYQDRYESAFLIVSGDLKKPITWKQIPEFLECLFPTFPYRFSSYNINETLRAFGRDGSKSRHLFWSDIRKGLRDRKGNSGSRPNQMLIKTVLNPES